jgi:hypothetical protein
MLVVCFQRVDVVVENGLPHSIHWQGLNLERGLLAGKLSTTSVKQQSKYIR